MADSKKVKFYRGLKANYAKDNYVNGLYFATDTKELWLDGSCYGGLADDASALEKAIVSASVTYATSSAAGSITLTAKDKTTTTITLPSVNASNGITVNVGDNGSYTVAVKIDADNNKLLKVGDNGIYAKASLAYDSATKELRLIGSDGTTIDSSIDATPFIKDGMIESVTFGKYADDSKTNDALVFTWNTDSSTSADKMVTKIKLTDIFNPYTIGDGLAYDSTNNTLSAKITADDKYIAVDSTGIHATTLVGTMDASIQANEAAIKVLNSDKTTTGSVAKAVDDLSTALVGQTTDASTASTINGAKNYAKELVGDLSTNLIGTNADASTQNTIYAAKKYAQDLRDDLDLEQVGGDGYYVKYVKQDNGQVSAEAASLDASAVAYGTTVDGDDSKTVNQELNFLATNKLDTSALDWIEVTA